MANEMTKLLDTITPEQYTEYTNTVAEQHSAFYQSGILLPTASLDQNIIHGGKVVTMPEWQQTSLVDQVLEEDKALVTGKVTARKQLAHVLYRGTGAAYTDLAAMMSGSNPITQVLNDFADYTLRSDNEILKAIVTGIFAGPLKTTHVSDQSKAKNNVISPEMVIDARSILGTSRQKLTVIAMHSKVKAELEKQNVQTKHFIPASESKSGFDTYLGMRVVEDDALIDDNGVYSTYLYAQGAFGVNTATPADMITYEPDRDAAKGNNMLYVRRARVLHPFGLSFTGKKVSAVTPTNEDLADPTNWEKVAMDDKKIGIVCLKHKLSADAPEDVAPKKKAE
ncbi:MAG: head protein [Aerococcus sp.]|nr:head protein [Aerococcus sp.]